MDVNVEVSSWLESEAPYIWSLLNMSAQRRLPPGIVLYIGEGSPSAVQLGRDYFAGAEEHLKVLARICGRSSVEAAYRRHLSGLGTEAQVAELLCEIAVCAALARSSDGQPQLRPLNATGTACDFAWKTNGLTSYCEIKRYEDPWPSESDSPLGGRSLGKVPTEELTPDTRQPRYLDLQRKVQRVPKQLPRDSLGILFILHRSIGETAKYIQQCLFGESNFFVEPEATQLDPDGLFASEDWRSVSACCWVRVVDRGVVQCMQIWPNPNATVPLPDVVRNLLWQLS